MLPTQLRPSPIHSSLASDPELGPMVEEFVVEMPSRIAWMQRHLEAGDWLSLKRAAHQMKGAAGSYGFDELTPHALKLETLLGAGASPAEVSAAFRELTAHCRRLTSAPSR